MWFWISLCFIYFCNSISMLSVRNLNSVGSWLFTGIYFIISFGIYSIWYLENSIVISPVTISTLTDAALNSFLIKSSRNVAKIFVANLLVANGEFSFHFFHCSVGCRNLAYETIWLVMGSSVDATTRVVKPLF